MELATSTVLNVKLDVLSSGRDRALVRVTWQVIVSPSASALGVPCPLGPVYIYLDGRLVATITLNTGNCNALQMAVGTVAATYRLTYGQHTAYAQYLGGSFGTTVFSPSTSNTVSFTVPRSGSVSASSYSPPAAPPSPFGLPPNYTQVGGTPGQRLANVYCTLSASQAAPALGQRVQFTAVPSVPATRWTLYVNGSPAGTAPCSGTSCQPIGYAFTSPGPYTVYGNVFLVGGGEVPCGTNILTFYISPLPSLPPAQVPGGYLPSQQQAQAPGGYLEYLVMALASLGVLTPLLSMLSHVRSTGATSASAQIPSGSVVYENGSFYVSVNGSSFVIPQAVVELIASYLATNTTGGRT